MSRTAARPGGRQPSKVQPDQQRFSCPDHGSAVTVDLVLLRNYFGPAADVEDRCPSCVTAARAWLAAVFP